MLYDAPVVSYGAHIIINNAYIYLIIMSLWVYIMYLDSYH